jgi:hypothetical protein
MSTKLIQGQIVKIKSIPKGYRGPLRVGDSVTLYFYESNSTWTIKRHNGSKWIMAFGFTRANFDLPKTTRSESTELFSVDADFLKQAHAAACSEWKEKLEQKYPKVFVKQLAVSEIYKINKPGASSDELAIIRPTKGPEEIMYIADGLAPAGLEGKCLALGRGSQFKFEIAEGGRVVILVPKA